jgi:hypothetical protein
VHRAPPGTPSRAPVTAGAGAARVLLALTLTWAGAVGVWRLSAFARTVSRSGLVPDGAARATTLVWCVAALVAAVALVPAPTVRAGAVLALVVAAAAAAVSTAAWIRGTPVMCACVSPVVRHATRDHVEALAGDVILLALALMTLHGSREDRTGSDA